MKPNLPWWLLLLISFAFTAATSAQTIQWANQAGGIREDMVSLSLTDHYGNVCFPGTYIGSQCFFNKDTLYNFGGYNGMFLAKYDAKGKEMWVKQYGETSHKEITQGFEDMVFDNATSSIFTTGQIVISEYVIRNFIAKMNPDGDFIWMKTFEGLVDSRSGFRAIALDERKNIYVAGSISYPVKFDSIIVQKGGFIAKFDSNGTCLWAERKFSYNELAISSVDIGGIRILNHNIIISGCLSGDFPAVIDTLPISHPGSFSSMIMCFDSTGHIKWITEGLSWKTLTSATPGTDNSLNIYFTGSFRDSIVFPGHKLTTWPGLKDIFIVKMDRNGVVKWAQQTRASVCDGGSISTDNSGNSYVAGYFKGLGHFGSHDVHSLTSQDAFLARYDSSGNSMGVIHFPNGVGDGISQDSNGNPAFNINFTGSTTVGGTQYQNYGYYTDLLFVKCSAITGIGGPEPGEEERLLIFANPTTGKCTVTLPTALQHEKDLVLRVFDSGGRLVGEYPLDQSTGKIQLNVEALAQGIYQVVVSGGGKVVSGKVVFKK